MILHHMSKSQNTLVNSIMIKENDHYPQEYQSNSVEFFYRDFFVDESVLIPRFETESLVRRVIQESINIKPDILIDVGTGSGIIPISIIKNILPRHPELVSVSPNQLTYWLEISPEALDVARKNGEKHETNIIWQQSDLLGFFLENPESINKNQVIFLTANLPYIKDEDWKNMSADTVFEPKIALFWGEQTGFELYELFFQQVQEFFKIFQPRQLTIFIEFGFDQRKIAEVFFIKNWFIADFFADPAGIERFAKVELS